jgi:hypothetical protein
MVDDRGRPNILDIQTQPAELSDMESMVEREIKRRRFRPLIIDGEITESETQTFTHEFRYRKTELEEIRSKMAAEEQATAEN